MLLAAVIIASFVVGFLWDAHDRRVRARKEEADRLGADPEKQYHLRPEDRVIHIQPERDPTAFGRPADDEWRKHYERWHTRPRIPGDPKP